MREPLSSRQMRSAAYISWSAIAINIMVVAVIVAALLVNSIRIHSLQSEVKSLLSRVTPTSNDPKGTLEKDVATINRIESATNDIKQEVLKALDETKDLQNRLTELKDEVKGPLSEVSDLRKYVKELVRKVHGAPWDVGQVMIWFVHCSELQEKDFHHMWAQVDDRLNESKNMNSQTLKGELVCFAQEGDRITKVYSRGDEGRPVGTPASAAPLAIKGQHLWDHWRKLVENRQPAGSSTTQGVIIVIVPGLRMECNPSLPPEAVEIPIHILLVRDLGGDGHHDASGWSRDTVVNFDGFPKNAKFSITSRADLDKVIWDVLAKQAQTDIVRSFLATE